MGQSKAKADAAKEAIDKATTNAAVDQAQSTGTREVTSVNPDMLTKSAAKQSINEVLKAKNNEIDARTDLTDEEKNRSKAEQKLKWCSERSIDKATTNAAVDQAQSTGTREVTSVNPEALTKSVTKQSIDEVLKAKNNEIDARTDLTDEEKTVKVEAKAKADEAKSAIDNATTNAAVDQAQTIGTIGKLNQSSSSKEDRS